MIHIEHSTTSGLLANRLLSLLLCPDKEDIFSFGYDIPNELIGFLEELNSFLKIDDINSISCPKDIWFHFRVPTFRLMAEMNPSLQKFFHRYRGHRTLHFFSISPPLDKNKRIKIS